VKTEKMEREDEGPDQYQCDNCSKVWTFEQLHSISDLSERVEAGGIVPAGECPECGCLSYAVKHENPRSFARVSWTAEDVRTLREDLTQDQAEAFLRRHERHIATRITELGWDVLETLLNMDEEILKA